MIDNPDRYIGDFAAAGADILAVHVEVLPHLHRTIQTIREHGMRPAAVLNPSTPLSTLDHVLPDLDMVLIMSVNPGFGGQSFIPESLAKVRKLRRMIDEKGLDVMLEVDGGIKADNVAPVAEAGADVFVSGSGIFKTPDYKAAIDAMRRAATEAAGR
jgi:ribulose-phosphate 3-epimerase